MLRWRRFALTLESPLIGMSRGDVNAAANPGRRARAVGRPSSVSLAGIMANLANGGGIMAPVEMVDALLSTNKFMGGSNVSNPTTKRHPGLLRRDSGRCLTVLYFAIDTRYFYY